MKTNNLSISSEQGFSLIETMISITTLGICLAYAMPLFLYVKISNSKSEIRTGAVIIAEKVVDNIRSKSFESIPTNDGSIPVAATVGVTANPELIPSDINSPTISEELFSKVMGRQYQIKIIYCEGLDADPAICDSNNKKFKVEINYNNLNVYSIEGFYTKI